MNTEYTEVKSVLVNPLRLTEKIFKNILKINNFLIFLSLYQPPATDECPHNKFQPIWSSRLAGYREHIYSNVLIYNYIN